MKGPPAAAEGQPATLPALASRLATVKCAVDKAAAIRWPLLLALAVTEGLGSRTEPLDLIWFAARGRQVLAGDLDMVYRDRANQSGPLQLVHSAFVLVAGPGRAAMTALTVIGNVMLLVLVLLGSRHLRRVSGMARSARLEFVAGAAMVLWFLPGDVWDGHFAQVAIPVLWMVAAVQMRAGRVGLAALLLGLSAGFEPWGVLAAPLLLLDPRVRSLLVSGSVFGVTVAALYLPFAVTGHFAVFDYQWPVGDATLAHLLWPHAAWFSWYMRAVQGALAITACAVVVLLLRRRAAVQVVWLAPMAAVLARLLIDPTMFSYYWVPVSFSALVALCCLRRNAPPSEVVAYLALLYLPVFALATLTLTRILLCLAAVGVAVVAARRVDVPVAAPGSALTAHPVGYGVPSRSASGSARRVA